MSEKNYDYMDICDPELCRIISKIGEAELAEIPHETMMPERLKKLAEEREKHKKE